MNSIFVEKLNEYLAKFKTILTNQIFHPVEIIVKITLFLTTTISSKNIEIINSK